MQKKTMTAAFFWCLGVLILTLTLTLAGSADLYDSVIRLHVLANSDGAEDQAAKLLVRDEVLSYCRAHFSLSDRDEAEAEIRRDLDGIRAAAEAKLREAGSADAVTVTLDRETYPTRVYDNLSLPAGTYVSLRVMIGAAEGKNWWCVLFPPMCLDSSTDAEGALLDAGMSEENVKTVTLDGEPYRIRFRILEWAAELREKFKREI